MDHGMWCMQQDNACLHVAKVVQNELQVRNIDTLPWPAISPDLAVTSWTCPGRAETSTTTTTASSADCTGSLSSNRPGAAELPQETMRRLIRSVRRLIRSHSIQEAPYLVLSDPRGALSSRFYSIHEAPYPISSDQWSTLSGLIWSMRRLIRSYLINEAPYLVSSDPWGDLSGLIWSTRRLIRSYMIHEAPYSVLSDPWGTLFGLIWSIRRLIRSYLIHEAQISSHDRHYTWWPQTALNLVIFKMAPCCKKPQPLVTMA